MARPTETSRDSKKKETRRKLYDTDINIHYCENYRFDIAIIERVDIVSVLLFALRL